MTKEQLRKELKKGERSFYDITHDEKNGWEWNWVPGNGCEIVKNSWYRPPDQIIYVKDTDVGTAVTDVPLNIETLFKNPETISEEEFVWQLDLEVDNILSNCYTRQDFLDIVNGSEWAARWLYEEVDWSCPETVWDVDSFCVNSREEMVEYYGEDVTRELETVCGLKF